VPHSKIAKLAQENGCSILEAVRHAGITYEAALQAIADPKTIIFGQPPPGPQPRRS
jgi:hypothetical protein